MVAFYNAADQAIYNKGYSFIPQERFRIGDPNFGGSTPTAPDPGGINTLPVTMGGGGGGGGFNPYNPDMSQIRQDYSPYAYRQAMASSGVGIPSGILSDSEFLYPPESKAEGLLNMIPYVGAIKRGAGFLKDLLPINQRAIMENEGRGMGIFTDDIGRIVQGPGAYDTGANVMAGYNLSQLTPETIEKRRAKIKETMSKPGYSGDLQKRLDALDEFEEMYFGPTGIKTRTDAIYKYRKDKKAAKKKAKEDAEFNAAFTATAPPNNSPNQDHDGDGIPNNVEAAGGSYDGGYHGAEGGFESTGSGGGAQLSSGMTTGQHSAFRMADGGRIYFMDGGLADLVDIYD